MQWVLAVVTGFAIFAFGGTALFVSFASNEMLVDTYAGAKPSYSNRNQNVMTLTTFVWIMAAAIYLHGLLAYGVAAYLVAETVMDWTRPGLYPHQINRRHRVRIAIYGAVGCLFGLWVLASIQA